eukprot:5901189-Pleurochrysis_carterae.AAC.2
MKGGGDLRIVARNQSRVREGEYQRAPGSCEILAKRARLRAVDLLEVDARLGLDGQHAARRAHAERLEDLRTQATRTTSRNVKRGERVRRSVARERAALWPGGVTAGRTASRDARYSHKAEPTRPGILPAPKLGHLIRRAQESSLHPSSAISSDRMALLAHQPPAFWPELSRSTSPQIFCVYHTYAQCSGTREKRGVPRS